MSGEVTLGRVLLVDDDENVTRGLARAFHREPVAVACAQSAEEALRRVEAEAIDVVVADDRMAGLSGLDLLARLRREHPRIARIVLTGHATVESAVRSINEGEVHRFFLKPCDPESVKRTVRQLLLERALESGSRRLLGAYVRQSALLRELERRDPGITHVRRDVEGAILLESDADDLDGLVRRIRAELAPPA